MPRTIFVATTGYTSREMYAVDDGPWQFYMVGSLGCVSAIALGLALVRPDLLVVAVDGDGALLMRLGALATNGTYAPANFLHVLLNNACHESTGAQATVADNVDFAALAAASGYGSAVDVAAKVTKLPADIAGAFAPELKASGSLSGSVKLSRGIDENMNLAADLAADGAPALL